jgi:hypothetical protein
MGPEDGGRAGDQWLFCGLTGGNGAYLPQEPQLDGAFDGKSFAAGSQTDSSRGHNHASQRK